MGERIIKSRLPSDVVISLSSSRPTVRNSFSARSMPISSHVSLRKGGGRVGGVRPFQPTHPRLCGTHPLPPTSTPCNDSHRLLVPAFPRETRHDSRTCPTAW
jgi:hypothetical protein